VKDRKKDESTIGQKIKTGKPQLTVFITASILFLTAAFSLIITYYPSSSGSDLIKICNQMDGWEAAIPQNKSFEFNNLYNIKLKPSAAAHYTRTVNDGNQLSVSLLHFSNALPGNEPFFFKPAEDEFTKGYIDISKELKLASFSGNSHKSKLLLSHWYIIDEINYYTPFDAMRALLKQIITKRKFDSYLCIVQYRTNAPFFGKNIDALFKDAYLSISHCTKGAE
jgi:hypothetical protein